jgi:hypothetical protein
MGDRVSLLSERHTATASSENSKVHREHFTDGGRMADSNQTTHEYTIITKKIYTIW